jgi:hypothetical protein
MMCNHNRSISPLLPPKGSKFFVVLDFFFRTIIFYVVLDYILDTLSAPTFGIQQNTRLQRAFNFTITLHFL